MVSTDAVLLIKGAELTVLVSVFDFSALYPDGVGDCVSGDILLSGECLVLTLDASFGQVTGGEFEGLLFWFKHRVGLQV